jgi:hypothetical protein
MTTAGDDELFARLARHAGGEGARLVAAKATPLPGGFVSKLVERIDLTLVTSRGETSASYVRKACLAREVLALEATSRVAGAEAAPELVAAWTSADAPEDQDRNGFVSPFYPGPAMHFGDPIPAAVIVSLARVHAECAGRPGMEWAWAFDAARIKGLADYARYVAAGSEQLKTEVEDHIGWLARLDRAAEASMLREAADTLPRSLTHGDMHPGNIVRRADGSPVIIDWGNACLAPPMLDLANIIAIDSDAWRLYWRAYHEAGGELQEAWSRRAFWWARATTALMYVPWAASASPLRVPDLIAQMEDATARLIATA